MDIVLMGETIDDMITLLPFRKTTNSRIGVSDEDSKALTDALEKIKPVVKILHVQDHKEAKVLLRNIKNAINDLNDLLEEISSTDCALPQQSSIKTRTSTIFSFKHDPHKDRKKAVNTEVENVIKALQNVSISTNTPTLTPSEEAREKIEDIKLNPTGIGRKKERKDIIDQILSLHTKAEKSKVVPVISALPIPVVTIVGGAGIGKTKLASLICDDEQVKAHFSVKIWVGDVDSLKKSVADTPLAKQKGYLVVMENLKTEICDEDLSKLREILTISCGKSAILITTSSKLVAINITANIRSKNEIDAGFISFRPHILQGLNELESQSLFQSIRGDDIKKKETEVESRSLFQRIRGVDIKEKEVEENDNDIKENEMENKYLKDCGGVPSLIIFAANFLKSHSVASTAAAATSATASTSSATVAPFKDADALKLEFLKKLKLTYYDKDLSRLQKMCFTFCSLFPRDHLIDVERLIHIWRAEGFLMDVKTTAEETLRECFNKLVERSIFRDNEEDECGVVKRCRMQPLMHDLARFVSDQDENVMVDPEGEKVNEEILRASFDFSLDVSRGIPSSLFKKAKRLRAILLWKTQTLLPKEGETSTSTCDQIFKAFKITLRMLDLHDMGIKTFPNSVGDMNNLRYLDLSLNTMEKLPSSITKLSNLQTLKLSQCYLLKELPKNIEELTNLNHLEIDGCLALTHMPSKIRKLDKSLQTLTLFVVSNDHSGGLEDLACLNKLSGHLEISRLEIPGLTLSKKDNYLNNKEHLQRLTLRWDHEDDQNEKKGDSSAKDMNTLECLEPNSKLRAIFLVGYKGENLSTWFSSIQCLVKLSLYDCTGCISLPQLDQLPKLRILELLRMDNLQYVDQEDGGDNPVGGYFPSLEELTISDCPCLKAWRKKDRPFFTRLSKLHVYYCPGLKCMPIFPDLDEELVLVGSRMEPLLETIVCIKKRYHPFSKLKSIKIASIIVESRSLSSRWIECFNSLEKLDIKEWKHLESLPKGFDHLSSLQSVNIENCLELDLDLSSTEWEGLKNLRSLTIRENKKLKSLPLGIDKVTSLQDLQFHNCSEMTSLPETIDNFKSLEKLEISECNKLAKLPKSLKNVKSLRTLIITDCALLLPRCQPNTGDDWPQIAHIENKQVTKTDRGL